MHPSPFSKNIVPSADRCPSITVRSRQRSLLQQTHELTHGLRNLQFRVTLDKDVQLGGISRPGLLAGRVVVALGRDGGAGGFEDLGDVGAVGDGPASFLCSIVSSCSTM